MNKAVREDGEESASAAELQRVIVAFSIAWLAAANLVGVWLALLLVRPEWGAILGEWTYGRWMALHLNWQLYGWCSLPLVGLLHRRYLPLGRSGLSQARWAMSLWSLALALGGISWLQGESSGKLFLDWAGFPRLIFVAALTFLWGVLAWNGFQPDLNPAAARSGGPRPHVGERSLLVALALVPIILYWSAGRRVYPAIDPGTGGPTGASLLGSTLVVVAVIVGIPKLLGLAYPHGRGETLFWSWFGVDCAIFLFMRHGNSSHREWQQIAGLGSLLAWVPVLAWHLRRFDWHPKSWLWLRATLWWWGALVVSGFASFLPGLLDRIKFTHALVAHAHLAMAGLLTSLNMLILLNLSSPPSVSASPLLNRGAFLVWHGGLLLQIAALFWLAHDEIADPGQLFNGGDPKGYFTRLFAGMLMAGASLYWATGAIRSRQSVEPRFATA